MTLCQKRFAIMSIFTSCIILAGGCGASNPDEEGDDTTTEYFCEPGANQYCLCEGGETGTQECKTDGSAWDDCVCAGDTDTDSDSDTDTNDDCNNYNPCSEHGTCDDSSGVVQCDCQDGWGGDFCDECAPGFHPDNDDCALDETCLPTTCQGHGECNDTTGIVLCTCDPGYTGDYCDECELGYHDISGWCTEDEECPETNECSGHGVCNDSTGIAVCTCDEGYQGDTCNTCASGYHLGEEPDSDAGADGGSGEEACVLDQQCMPNSCSGETHGTCADSTGEVVCTCNAAGGYTGTYCDECLAGFHAAGTNCVANEVCDEEPHTSTCSGHGDCAVVAGLVECGCDYGWSGEACSQCAPGFHLNAGACVIDQECLSTSCSGHGTCDDSTGKVVCTCTGGFTTSSYCSLCSTGFHQSGNACVFNETCATNTCNLHGTCQVVNYETVCACNEGWTGETCTECAAGFHHPTGDTSTCELDQTCLDSSCAGHGECDDDTKVVLCDCDEGYDDATYCMDCLSDYHEEGGLCFADETCIVGGDGDSCNGHGTCYDATGMIVCVCATGWTGELCDDCAAGYHFEHDTDGWDCVVDTTCLPTSCNYHGDCADSTGEVVCTCDEGWGLPNCAECADGYHDEGGACVANETCIVGGDDDSCGGHGTCDASTGVIVCTCYSGYLGDTCADCDTAEGYSACVSECCSSSQVCYLDECCNPLTCDDLDPFVECGETGVDDGCGGTIDCGDCGDFGACVSNVCDCEDNYGLLSGGHECVYACDGYLPAAGCCDETWLVYCDSGQLKTPNCAYEVPPNNVCGWFDSGGYFACWDGDTPPVTDVCPSNIIVDKNPPECVDDDYEDNDDDTTDVPGGATVVTGGQTVFGTKCPGDQDYYRIYLTVGQQLTATLTFNNTVADLDLIMGFEMLDDVTYVNLIDWSNNGTGVESLIFTAGDEYPYYEGQYTDEGWYYLKVWSGPSAQIGYQLEIEVI